MQYFNVSFIGGRVVMYSLKKGHVNDWVLRFFSRYQFNVGSYYFPIVMALAWMVAVGNGIAALISDKETGVDHVSWMEHWGMAFWQPLLGLLSWQPVPKSTQCNSFEDRAPVDFIYGCPDLQMSCRHLTRYKDSITSLGRQATCSIHNIFTWVQPCYSTTILITLYYTLARCKNWVTFIWVQSMIYGLPLQSPRVWIYIIHIWGEMNCQ